MAKREPRSWDEMEALTQQNVNHLAGHDTRAAKMCLPGVQAEEDESEPEDDAGQRYQSDECTAPLQAAHAMTLSLRNDVRMQSRMMITANTRGTGRNPGKGRTSRIWRKIWRSSRGMLTGDAVRPFHITRHATVVACPQLRSQGKGARHA